MRFDKGMLRLYAVTDRRWEGALSLLRQVELALQGGATMVQFREKHLQGAEKEALARELLALCRSHGVPLIINDDAELAKKVGADGVHVGQSDLAAQEARRILGPQAIIGVTARTVEQARAAQAAGADYLGSGAVFGTSSKSDARPLSREELRAICAAVTIPVVAIGGIHAGNVLALCGCGQAGVAVIGGIFGQPDIRQAARELLALSEQASQNKI